MNLTLLIFLPLWRIDDPLLPPSYPYGATGGRHEPLYIQGWGSILEWEVYRDYYGHYIIKDDEFYEYDEDINLWRCLRRCSPRCVKDFNIIVNQFVEIKNLGMILTHKAQIAKLKRDLSRKQKQRERRY